MHTPQAPSLPTRGPWPTAFLLLIASVFALFFELGRMDIVHDNEGQRAAPPAEMLRSGDWVIPTINGEDYVKKPPLLYWVTALVYRAAGEVSPFWARVPVAASALLLVMGLYFYLHRAGAGAAAGWTAFALLTSPYILERMRLAQLDVPLTLTVFLGIAAMNAAQRSRHIAPGAAFALLAGACLAAGLLIKGPAPVPFFGAAWGVHILLTSPEGARHIRFGLRASAAALLLALVCWAIYEGLGLYLLTLGEEAFTHPLLPAAKFFGLPFGLALAGLAWAWGVFRGLRERWLPQGAILAGVFAVGIVLALPWGAAVVQQKGWGFVQELLQTEVVERTHTATRINSGWPLYYMLAMPLLVAPWGFLLPLHTSRVEWRHGSYLYKFGALTGWLGVLCFSLVAGKEYEYVLPAVPWLLIPTGYHLAAMAQPHVSPWADRFKEWWPKVVWAILAAVAVPGAIFVAVEEGYLMLGIQAGLLAAVMVAAALWGRPAARRMPAIALMVLCAVTIGMLARAYHYTGDASVRELAQLVGRMTQQGVAVESFRVNPAFAFYAETPVKVETDVDAIRARLEGDAPYYYVVREKFLAPFQDELDRETVRVLAGPYTSKDVLLLGNRPLPDPGQGQ